MSYNNWLGIGKFRVRCLAMANPMVQVITFMLRMIALKAI